MADGKTSAGRPRGAARRWGGFCLVSALALVLLLGAGIGVAAIRLSNGPMRIDGLSTRVAAAVAERIGPGWTIAIQGSSLELDRENLLSLRFSGLDIHNPQGALVVRAPLALVSLDPWGLLRLNLQPRSIEFRDTQTTALIHRDGSIAFAAAEAAQPVDIAPRPAPEPGRGAVSPLSTALASVFGVVLDSGGVVGALDRARLTGARLRLIDDDGRERAVFARVDGLFGRDPVSGARSFELRLDGPHGQWRLGGSARETGAGDDGMTARAGTLTLDDLPVSDLMLLAGQSKVPVTTDLKLSGKADVSLAQGRIAAMTARLHTGDGTLLVEEKDFNPITVESLTASLSWDEAARTLMLTGLDYAGAGNAFHLTGGWVQSPPGADSAWTATLSGRDGTLRGAAAKDKPVRIATLDARLSGRAGGISIDDLALTGPGIAGRIGGTIDTSADDGGLTLRVTASDGEVRTGLRLWPENIAPGARTYLVDQLRGGHIDMVDIKVDMSGSEFAAAARGEPMPDNAVHIDFRVSNAAIDVSDDAPPVTKGTVTGVITGRSTTVRNVTAEVRGADGRGLTVTDGSFVIPEITPERVVAQIGMRLTGGADAMASVLQAKLFRSLATVDFEPGSIKGGADLRVDFPLDLRHVPDLPDIPVVLSGTLSDLTVDKVVGKERLESGKFALSYERGGFAMKGEGKVGGAPIGVDLRQPKPGQPGEAIVTLALDEALRAKKGLPVAPQLAGTIPVRAVVPMGRPGAGKAPIRVEADLTKAALDGLLPGLVKPAGKPGRLTFAMTETGSGLDLRDIVLDAAPGSARGSATIGESGLERAELTSLKLSPGDDLRVSLERSGNTYRVAVRGAVVDARPFLKSLTGPEGKAGKEASPKDVEADIQLPIVTGFNEEALTNASLKLSLHGRDLRGANITGRFRSAPFAATVTRGERGAPTLAVESADAGATLRFVDVYRRMHGGRLNAGIGLNDGPQAGIVQIRDFSLRDEPALSSIMAQGPETTDPETARGRRGAPQQGAGQASGSVSFDRMRANFVRTGTRVDFSDAAVSNAAMGFTLTGWLDTGRDRTDVNGTFVPLYGLNNAVAQVPLFGPLLAGGHNEGLFAVNFRVSGRLGNPDIAVNPLSAVAPGFLRKLFSAGGPFADGAPALPQSDR